MGNTQVKLIPKEIREADFPIARFLSEEEQARYEDSIKQFTGKAYDSLNVPIEGSNLFKVLWLNQIGIPTANLYQLEQVIENDRDFLRGHYEDIPSVVLRSNGDSYKPNDYLAKSLAEVIKERDFKHSLILNGLELKADENSHYGLILVPGEKFKRIEAPDFDYENNKRRFSRLDEKGLPIFSEEGNKTFYASKNGLCRLSLNDYLYLNSDNGPLVNSGSHGRVVFINSEGAEKNLEEYISKLRQEKEKQKLDIDERYNRAMNVLIGN